ncbi:MAG: winged helix-turn-helix domain-containing protein [Butyricicoccus sp.]|nr:winged helix-turn-helix domain-containing protein [Butyricicoccus sp.]MBQ8585474.1 winged helix-turn-helix domain-containing protein [Butyricicoccus sp.]
MNNDVLQMQVLGECALSCGEIRVKDSTRRTSKVWLLLAYLICNRERPIPQEELVAQLWGGDADEGYGGALKTTLWRVRQLLQPIASAVGQELILYRGGTYCWNPEIALRVDAEELEQLCRAAANAEDAEALPLLRRAAALYAGEFLEKFSAEAWVEPIAAFYFNLYLDAVLRLTEILPQDNGTDEIEGLCRDALRAAPYHEPLYQRLMCVLMAQGELKKAADVYEEMRELLFTNLGILPSEESQAILEEIRSQVTIPFLTADMLHEQLREKDPPPGALFCDYETFKTFYQAEARSASRRGDAVHVGVLSVVDPNGKELSPHVLERTMDHLRSKVLCGLRRGDVVARCSASQYVVLLLQANFENSNMVCERLVRSYTQAYPRSIAQIRFTVLPLEPLQGWPQFPNGAKAGWGKPNR